MTISQERVFDIAKQRLLDSYPDAGDITMPYCSLNSAMSAANRHFRVQLDYHRITNMQRSAVFEINAESGAVEMFRENYNYTFWS